MKIIYSMVDDDKSRCLNRALNKYGYSIYTPALRSIFFPFFIIKSIFSGKRPQAIIIRYLNDSESMLLSLGYLLSRVATIFLAKLLGVKILWFCHNVDRETKENYPRLTSFLRGYLQKRASSIFVMDEMLVSFARKKFNKNAEKVDFINFGERENEFRIHKKNDGKEVVSLLRKIKKEFPENMIAFCPTAGGEKYIHIRYAAKMVSKARETGLPVSMVLVGDLKQYLSEQPEIAEEIRSEPDIHCIDSFVDYKASDIVEYIDFYWRGLSDYSISYSLYEAATQGLPTLALQEGFIGEAVEYYGLGATVASDFEDLKKALGEIGKWDEGFARSFLAGHSWDNAAQRLVRSL